MAHLIKVQLCAECKSYVAVNKFSSHVCTNHAEISPNMKPLKPIEKKPSTEDSVDNELMELDLIHCVEVRRALWDHKSVKPVDRSEAVKNKLWREICEELGDKYNVDALKTKWKYMRDEYTRRKKGSKSGSGTKKELFYTRHLAFLDDMIFYDPTVTNLDLETSSTSKSDFQNTSGNERKKRKTDNQDNINTLINKLILTRPKTPPPDISTADDKFGVYLVSIMANLSKERRRKLQGEFITTVLSEPDMEMKYKN